MTNENLIGAGWLPRLKDPSARYRWMVDGRVVVASAVVGDLNLSDNAEVFVDAKHTGAALLSREERAERRRGDWELLQEMAAGQPELLGVWAYRSMDALVAGGPPVEAATAVQARFYRVELRGWSLVVPGVWAPAVTFTIDTSSSSYPSSEPPVYVAAGSPVPFSIHFHPERSVPICAGPFWPHRRGYVLLAELVVHLARLVNHDEEPDPEDRWGYQPAAAEYHDRVFGHGRPVDPNRRYPQLPARVHATVEPAAVAAEEGAADAAFGLVPS